MLVDLFVLCMVLIMPTTYPSPAEVVEASGNPARSEWLATVRHFDYARSSESWGLAFRITEQESPAVNVWWIVGEAVQTGLPARSTREAGLEGAKLPDTMSARSVNLTVEQCPALSKVAGGIEKLFGAAVSPNSRAKRSTLHFVLETPVRDPIELGDRAADDPAVQWADLAWSELSACAEQQLR